MPRHPAPELIALGIRQPWAELIVRGVKTIEVRTVDTAIRGPIYVYSSRKVSDHPAAARAAADFDVDLASLPRGLLVGTVAIESTGPLTEADAAAALLSAEELRQTGRYGWRLTSPERLESPLSVRFLPYGIWFYPFRRRGQSPEPAVT
jgi:hypothetical protein